MISKVIGSFRLLTTNENALLLGQAVSMIGDFMALPAFVILAARRHPAVLMLFFIVYFMPRCAQPFLGALVDRYDARRVALVADAARTVIFVVLFLYPESYPSAPWLLAVFAASAFGALFEPARLKIMSAVAVDFVDYSKIFNVVNSSAGVASLAFALLIEQYGRTEVIFITNALTFAISFGFLTRVAYKQSPATTDARGGFKQWIEGFMLLKQHHAILYSSGLVILVDFFTGALYEEFPHKAAIVGFGAFGTYVYYFVVCLGNTVGALLIRPGLASTGRLGLLCAFGAASVSVFIESDSLSLSIMSCLCFFSVQILAIVSSEIAIQRVIPAEYHGRVFAINESLPYLALSLGGTVAGVLGLPAIFALCVCSFPLFYLLARAALETDWYFRALANDPQPHPRLQR